MPSYSKVPREIPDIVEALQRHVRLLKDYAVKAFRDVKPDYFGEVAAKLRLLCYEGGMNKPLLLHLMDTFESDIRLTLGGPPTQTELGHPGPGDQITLREYLTLEAAGVQTPSKGFVMLTKKELISNWANQHGAAHEDWELEETLFSLLRAGIYVGSLPMIAKELEVTTEAVLSVANQFLNTLTPELIELKAADKYLERTPGSLDGRCARGVALGKLRRYEEALAELESVVEEDPNHAPTHNNIGLALLKLNRLSDAADAFARAIGIEDSYANAHYNLACVYSLQGRFDKCLEHLEAVKALDGFINRTVPATDSDLANIRDDPAYGPKFIAVVDK